MKTLGKLIAICFASALLTSGASAQAPAAAPDAATPAAPATPSASGKHAQSAQSLECSKKADARKLHGRKRKTFRDECKKGHVNDAQ